MKNRNLNHGDNWATPKELYNILDEKYKFDFDPCPLAHDLRKWNGLTIEWGKRNFVNPPYSLKLKTAFVLKAIEESKKKKLCVVLIPVSTSTALFHDHIQPNAKKIIFIRGRIKFAGVNTKGQFVNNKPPMHDSMLVIFKGK